MGTNVSHQFRDYSIGVLYSFRHREFFGGFKQQGADECPKARGINGLGAADELEDFPCDVFNPFAKPEGVQCVFFDGCESLPKFFRCECGMYG